MSSLKKALVNGISANNISAMPDSMSLRHRGRPSARHDPEATLTGRQIKAARMLLRWGHTQLAEAADVGSATIFRAEGYDGVPAVQLHTLNAIQAALERAGVMFIDADKRGGIGVRLIGR